MSIPVYGNITRPSSHEEGIKEIESNLIDWNLGDIEITFTSGEVVSMCPKTNQPDFNTVTILYVPDKKYIESKSMKFYLWSLMEYGIHCEKMCYEIAAEIKRVINCKKIVVEVKQNIRGGVALSSKVEM